MKLKELGLGYLNSHTIAEAIEELKTLDLEADVNAYENHYKCECGSAYDDSVNPVILTVERTANALRLVQDLLGKPISYEKLGFYRYVIKREKRKFGGTDERIQTLARALDWSIKSLSKTIEASTLFAKNFIPFYVSSRNGIRIYCPADCYIPILYESDDPKEWLAYNTRKSTQWAERKKIRKVEKRLDKE